MVLRGEGSSTGTCAYESIPVLKEGRQPNKWKAPNRREEGTMPKLLIAGVLFVLMLLWTWYNYVS